MLNSRHLRLRAALTYIDSHRERIPQIFYLSYFLRSSDSRLDESGLLSVGRRAPPLLLFRYFVRVSTRGERDRAEIYSTSHYLPYVNALNIVRKEIKRNRFDQYRAVDRRRLQILQSALHGI